MANINALPTPKVLSILILCISSLGFVIWRLECFPFSDDLPYSTWLQVPSNNAFWTSASHIPIESPSQAFRSAINHYMAINGRLSNITCILLQPLPRPLYQIINGLMCAMLPIAIALAAYGRKGFHTPFAVGLAVIASILLLPWDDKMASDDFALNYVWASVLSLSFLIVFNRTIHKSYTIPYIFILMLAFITGWWHEGFAIPVLSASVVILYQNRCTPKSHRLAYVILAVFIIGMLLSLSPGQISRIWSANNSEPLPEIQQRLRNIIHNNLLIFPYAIIFILSYFHNGRKRSHNLIQDQLPWIAATIISLIISGFFGGWGRLNWMSILFLLTAILRISYTTWSWFQRPHRVLTLISASFIILFFLGVIYWQREVRINTMQIFATLRTRHNMDGSIAYVDAITEEQIPWYASKFVRTIFYAPYDMGILSHYVGFNDTCVIILPNDLFGRPFDDSLKVNGDNPFYGIFPYYYTKNRINPTSYQLTLGNALPSSSMNIFTRLLMSWKNRHNNNPSDKSTVINMHLDKIAVTADGDTIYTYYTSNLGRTVHGREILALDALGQY